MIQTANRANRLSHAFSRKALMMSSASFALAAAALAPQQAQAQAFQGSIGSSSGSVTRTPLTGTSETITIGSSTATINWSPNDQATGGGAIDFLPSANTATFTSASGVTDYTVLNRIVPVDTSRPIALNGHVISTLQGTSTTGGKVWFYSPGGLVIGATAVFDVGGLLLTSSDVTNLSTNPSGFSATFNASAPGATVSIADGAKINALAQGSYVAIVAPRIEQGGAVRVNGSAAYVGAEAVTLTMNQGLFDIQVDAGTSDSNGIVHTGSTTGPANESASDHHSVYMVAVPKNNALTMLLQGGSVGFDATQASVKNGQIILSSGYGVSGTNFVSQPAGNGPASLSISGGDFSSSVAGRATGWIGADGGGWALSFAGDLSLQSDQGIGLFAGNGETISVDGGLQLLANDDIIAAADGGSISADSLVARTAGGVLLEASSGWEGNPGSLTFGSVTANANGGDGPGGGVAVIAGPGSTIALGHADLRASGSSGGDITLSAGACDCSEGDFFGAQALGESGGISADDLLLIASGDLNFFVGSGATIDVAGAIQGWAGQAAWVTGDGSSSAIMAHEFDLNAITITDTAPILADIIRFTAAGDMSVGDLSVTDTMALNAGGDITAGDITATNRLDVHAVGSLNAGDLQSSDVDATAFADLSAGDVDAGTAIVTATGDSTVGDVHVTGSAIVTAGQDLVAGDVTSGGTLDVHVAGDAALDDVSGQTLRLTADHFTFGHLSGVDVNLFSSSGLSVNDVDASHSATFTTNGLASFFGIVASPTITVTSHDIEIADGASLGVSGPTKLVTLNAVSSGLPIILGDGGSASEGQYELSEDGDIHSEAVVLHAVGTSPAVTPDVHIFNADIDGSASEGGGVSSVTIQTGGSIFVLGQVQVNDVGVGDKITLDAGDKIQVATDTGSIVMTDSSGHLAGTLDLKADAIWIGQQALLDQLASDPNFAGRDAALATHSGADNPDGFVRAGTITASVADSLFVQNSGTPELFAGIDTGVGGLSLTSTGATPATVIAYGRQTLADGTTIINQDFLASVELFGTAGFTTDSEVNGCAIGGGTCSDQSFVIDYATILGAMDSDDKDDQDEQADSDDGDGSASDPALKLVNTTPVNLDRQIDDPVTSGAPIGN